MRCLCLICFIVLISCSAPRQNLKQTKDPYCNVDHKVINESKNGKSLNEYTKTIIECDDGPKSFMKKSGLASDCRYFNWRMPLGNTYTEQRTISCRRLDGGYEIIPNYKLQN